MEQEIKLATECSVCHKTRRGIEIPIRGQYYYNTKVTLCTYCVVEIVVKLLTPTDRKPKPGKEKQR